MRASDLLGLNGDGQAPIGCAGTVSYTVNANGNLEARGADTFAYDAAHRLTSATIAGATSSYGYNGDGLRVTHTSGATTTRYVSDVNRALPVVLDDGTRKYVWGAAGLAYSVDTANTLTVYHTDGLGSVGPLTDGGGSVEQAYQTHLEPSVGDLPT